MEDLGQVIALCVTWISVCNICENYRAFVKFVYELGLVCGC